MHEVFRQIKVIAYNTREGIIGCLVGIAGSPVCQCKHLLLGESVGEQRTVMSLHCQLIPIAIGNDVRLHTIAHKQITQLWGYVHLPWIQLFSYRHSFLVFLVILLRIPSLQCFFQQFVFICYKLSRTVLADAQSLV